MPPKAGRGIPRLTIYALIGVGIALIGLAAASSVLFTQSFPSTSAGTVTADCSDLQEWGVLPAGGGMAIFNCTTYAGAFEVNTPTTATPSFSLPTNATSAYIFPATPGTGSGTGSCDSLSGAVELISGSSVAFSAEGSWEYCVDATGSFPGFTVSWSQ